MIMLQTVSGYKEESPSEKDDSSDIDTGEIGVNDGDNHALDDTEKLYDSSSSSHSMHKTVRTTRILITDTG